MGEDIDLCWRLQLAGYRFSVADGAVVRKREPVDERSIAAQGLVLRQMRPRSLYRHYRATGMHRDVRGAIKAWLWLLVNVPRLFERQVRRQWLRTLAIRAGRLSGSVTQRVFFP